MLKTDFFEQVGKVRPFDEHDSRMVRQFLFHETTGGAGNPGSPITFMLELGYADANGFACRQDLSCAR